MELTGGFMTLLRSYVDVPLLPWSAQALVDFIQDQRQANSLIKFMGALAIIAYVSSVALESVVCLVCPLAAARTN